MLTISAPTTSTRADKLRDLEHLADAAGVALPKPYTTAATEHRQILARARMALEPNPAALVEAVTAALVAGRDVDTDEAVQTALARATVTERRTEVLRALAAREAVILRDNRDAIVKACGKAAEGAYEALREAARVAPGLDRLATSERVLSAAPTVTAAWMAARDAQARLKALGSLLRQLPKGRIHTDDEYLLHLEPTPALSAKARRTEWDAALEGHELTWCGDLAGFRDRVMRTTEQRTNAESAAKAQEIAERQKQTGPIVKAYAARAAADA